MHNHPLFFIISLINFIEGKEYTTAKMEEMLPPSPTHNTKGKSKT